MESKQKRLRLLALISAIILWLTTNVYYFWIKVVGGIFLLTGLVQFVCFLTVLTTMIFLTFRIFKKVEWRNLKNYLTISSTVLVLIALNFRQLRANENTFQSPVKMRACYEGTMNTSRLYFRENGTFEDFNIGWFAHVHYRNGTWSKHGDTLHLDFKGKNPKPLDSVLIIKGDNIFKLQEDTLAPTLYYMGYCKGLN